MLTLIENGIVYAPELCGPQSVLLVNDRINKIGEIDREALEATGLQLDVIDATHCVVTPGFIDPHQHLLGGSGEDGFATQTPEIYFSEIVLAGITTVVGCLGVDTNTKTMPGLLAKAKGLREEGITAFIWSGGYDVPPKTLTGSIGTDMLFVEEVIGAGEIAIADHRSMVPTLENLARIVSETHVGGLLSHKAGVTHFHIGDGKARLQPLRDLLVNYEISPEWLYPTHVERHRALLEEAADFTRLGAYVDVDVMEEDLSLQLRLFLERNGDPQRLTISSDASIASPRTLHEQLRDCVLNHDFPFERVLRLLTENTARVLKLNCKGRVAMGYDADVVLLHHDSLEIQHVFAHGKHLVKDGSLVKNERFLAHSNRRIELYGSKPKA